MSTRGLVEKPVLLFDLGGVLFDLGNPADAMKLELTDDEFWDAWLGSPIVHDYETGRLTSCQFYEAFGPMVGVSDPSEFARRLQQWQLLPFPGIEDLLHSLSGSHRLALLSNTNEVHWLSVLARTQIFSRFSDLFLSYEIGHLKPNVAVFEFVLSRLGCDPSEILFFDDTEANVVSARRSGIDARQVSGIASVRSALNGL